MARPTGEKQTVNLWVHKTRPNVILRMEQYGAIHFEILEVVSFLELFQRTQNILNLLFHVGSAQD